MPIPLVDCHLVYRADGCPCFAGAVATATLIKLLKMLTMVSLLPLSYLLLVGLAILYFSPRNLYKMNLAIAPLPPSAL